ncbi:hypothetical protein ZWY2020_033356 [Hordeum vulgare]|nr:hypothetical protein ZWY2020_033356 [Hordeum vulgare]
MHDGHASSLRSEAVVWQRCGGDSWHFVLPDVHLEATNCRAVAKEKRNGPPQQQPHQQQQYRGRGGTGRAYAVPDFHCGDEGRCDHPSKHHRAVDVEVGVGGGKSAVPETRQRRTTTEDFVGGYIRCKLPLPPSGSTMIGYKRQSCQAIILRRKSPDDINSNQSLGGDSENVNAEGPTVDQPQNTKRQKTRGTEGRRISASPARLFKLNKDLNFEQKDAKYEAKSVSEVVQESIQENLFHLSDVEDRFQKFMSLSGKTTNAVEVNVLDVGELLASAMVIAYGGYFVTVRELAKSMKKEGFVLSHVMEVGIQSIMFNLPPDSKKVLMPLRFSIWLQKMELTSKELISRFKKSNHLDSQDMIMFPVLENIDKTEPVTRNHYWIFNVNIRNQCFEVLDSWRTLKNKSLDVCTRKIVASVRVLWEEHYARSHICLDDFGLINIDVPQQDNG